MIHARKTKNREMTMEKCTRLNHPANCGKGRRISVYTATCDTRARMTSGHRKLLRRRSTPLISEFFTL
jgi:hypothetical protein